MKAIKIIIVTFCLVIASIVLVSYIIWLGFPKTKLNIYVLDKTVKDFSYDKHKALFWVLNNSRFIKKDGGNYKPGEDYYGFMPQRPLSSRLYDTRKIKLEQIDSISDATDVLYYTDTYGVYFNEWFRGFREGADNAAIDGGLNQNDYLLAKAMKQKHKLVIGEYNILGPPTSELIRYKTQELFGIETTGWYGKYFDDLDSSNTDIPMNIITMYKSVHNGEWPFKNGGIIFVSPSNVIVLEEDKHLLAKKPVIVTTKDAAEFDLTDQTIYTNWFEIVKSTDSLKIIANFQFNLTDSGDSLLKEYGLSSSFPAVLSYDTNGANMFYFAGDFSTNDITYVYARLANVRKILKMFTSDDQKLFFHNFYFPLIENILKNYSKSVNSNTYQHID